MSGELDIQRQAFAAYLANILSVLQDNRSSMPPALQEYEKKLSTMLSKKNKERSADLTNDLLVLKTTQLSKLYEEFHDIIRKIANDDLSGLILLESKERKLSNESDLKSERKKQRIEKEKQKEIEKILNTVRGTPELNAVFIAVYENDSKIDDFIYKQIMEGRSRSQIKELAAQMKAATNRIKALASMAGIGNDPLRQNNIPYVAFRKEELPHPPGQKERTCVRFGSQIRNMADTHSVFLRSLLAKAAQSTQDETVHVYINLMRRRESLSTGTMVSNPVESTVIHAEGARSAALEAINNNPAYKTKVVTLPADGEFFLGKFRKKQGAAKQKKEEIFSDLMKEIQLSIQENKNDFYFTDDDKKKLFSDNTVKRLFERAAKEIFGRIPQKMTAEQRQALLFHFIKYVLTKHILDTFEPSTYNISCKSAMDRGAIHSVWYHMNLKYDWAKLQNDTTQAMTQEEFLKHLGVPALLVEQRAINENENLIWNVLNIRLQQDPTFARYHPWAKPLLQEYMPKEMKKARQAMWVTSSAPSLSPEMLMTMGKRSPPGLDTTALQVPPGLSGPTVSPPPELDPDATSRPPPLWSPARSAASHKSKKSSALSASHRARPPTETISSAEILPAKPPVKVPSLEISHVEMPPAADTSLPMELNELYSLLKKLQTQYSPESNEVKPHIKSMAKPVLGEVNNMIQMIDEVKKGKRKMSDFRGVMSKYIPQIEKEIKNNKDLKSFSAIGEQWKALLPRLADVAPSTSRKNSPRSNM